MLEIREITQKYGEREVLHGISLQFSEGVYALLGPNGAGKSTLIRIITDSLLPSSGQVFWNDIPILEMGSGYREILGYMPQQQGLYDNFSGRSFLQYIGILKEIPASKMSDEILRVATLVKLVADLERPIGCYSGGMKQRIMMAQAIMGTPKLLIMDEPTAGLDPIERVRTRNLIKQLAQNCIILVATHVVSDIESIAKDVIIINQGNIVAQGSPHHLIDEYAPTGGLEDVYVKIFGVVEDEQI